LSILDIWFIPESKDISFYFRLIFVFPIVLFCLIITFKKTIFQKYFQQILAIIALVTASGTLIVLPFIKETEIGYHTYFLYLSLIIVWNFTVLRIRFYHAFITNFIVFCIFIAIEYYHFINIEDVSKLNDFFIIINKVIILSWSFLVGIIAGYFIERSYRIDFIQNKRIAEAQAEIKETGDRFKKLFDSSPDAIFVEDKEGFVIDANVEACKIHGIKKSELIGKNVIDLVPEKNQREVKLFYPKWFSGEVNQAEGYTHTTNKKAIPVEIRGNIIQYANEKALLLHVRDITDRRKIEETLRQNEAKYRRVFEQASVSIIITSSESVRFANPKLLGLLGVNKDKISSISIIDYIHPDDKEKVISNQKNRLEGKKVEDKYDIRIIHTNSQILWVEIQNTLIEWEKEPAVLTFVIDNTERKKMQNSIEENELKLKAIFKSIPIPSYLFRKLDNFFVLEKFNEAAFKVTHGQIKNFIGTNHIDLYKNNPKFQKDIVRCFVEKCTISYNYSHLFKKSGKLKHYAVKFAFVFPDMVLLHTEDITKQIEIREELIVAKKEAEEANVVKSDFLASMSHEMRTPMNAIMGFNNLMETTKLTNLQQEYQNNLQNASERLMSIIKDILDLSKIKAKGMMIENNPFDIFSFIEKIVEPLKKEIAEKGIGFSLNIDQKIPKFLIGDEHNLQKIIGHLLGNAFKYTNSGNIDFSIKQIHRYKKQTEKVVVQFSIKDSGIGIEEKNHKKIFERFTQVDTSVQREFGGIGLGLTICKQLVELMNGKIWVESQLGKGSVFCFTILFNIDEQNEKSQKQKNISIVKSKSNKVPKLTILYVEDNPMNAHIVKSYFVKKGHNISIALNGRIAIDYLSKKSFDIILMDIEMPVMDGIKASEIIRDENSEVINHKVPIIAVTAHDTKKYRSLSKEIGINHFFTKPVKLEELHTLVQSCL